MGILDDALRKHLDLKRKHGARDAELREIEDEAFGSAEQPDPFTANEIFTEVGSGGPEAGNEEPARLVEAEALRPTEEPDAFEPSQEPEALRSTEEPPEAEPPTSDEPIDTLEPPSEEGPASQVPGQA